MFLIPCTVSKSTNMSRVSHNIMLNHVKTTQEGRNNYRNTWAPHFAGSGNSNLPAPPGLLFLDSAFRGIQEQQPANHPKSAVPGLRISRSPGTATCPPPGVCCSWTPHFVESRNSNLPATPGLLFLDPHFAESRNSNLPATPGLLFLDSAFRGVQEQQPASHPGSAFKLI